MKEQNARYITGECGTGLIPLHEQKDLKGEFDYRRILKNNSVQFEYKGFKFGISRYGEEFHFYSQKMIDRNKPQQPLKAKSLNSAIKEVEKIIDSTKKQK